MLKSDLIDVYRRRGLTATGAVRCIAGQMGITPQAVHQWPDQLDFQRQCIAEILTGGELKAQIPGGVAPPSVDTIQAIRMGIAAGQSDEQIAERLARGYLRPVA